MQETILLVERYADCGGWHGTYPGILWNDEIFCTSNDHFLYLDHCYLVFFDQWEWHEFVLFHCSASCAWDLWVYYSLLSRKQGGKERFLICW